MSLNCRILRRITDGKIWYYYRDSITTPSIIGLVDELENIPKSIRFRFDELKPQDTGPDFARFLGVQSKLYPNFPNCTHPDYLGECCIAEMCKYALDGDWKKCPYFNKS